MIVRGKAFRDVEREGWYFWHEYEKDVFGQAEWDAVEEANRLAPRKGGYIDPYFRAVRELKEMGVKARLVRGRKKGKAFVEES